MGTDLPKVNVSLELCGKSDVSYRLLSHDGKEIVAGNRKRG